MRTEKINQVSTWALATTSKLLLPGLLVGCALLLASCSISASQGQWDVTESEIVSEDRIPVTGETARICKDTLGYDYPASEILCQVTASSRLWTLQTKGRHGDVTTRFEISHGMIQSSRVLSSREQRGRQISTRSFLAQFTGLSLSNNGSLERRIHGITGATTSSRAVERAALLALRLDAAKP